MKKKYIKIGIITSINLFFLFILLIFVIQPLNSIRDVQKNPHIIIVDEKGNELMHYVNKNRTTPIRLERLDSRNIDLLLYIEDKSFYKHSGFNLQRIAKTFFSNLFQNESYGASTITQQYIKNIYLDQSKTFSRKIKELYYAIKLEQIATKDEILEGYLNCIYLGNNIYGLANGAKYYFNMEYEEIGIKEMICLIALLNAPSHYANNIEEWNQKKNELALILYNGNCITKQEYNYVLTDIELYFCESLYPSPLLYYCDAVLDEFKSYTLTSKFNQEIIIHTKYNEALNQYTPTTSANIASIAIDSDGFILSCIGDKSYQNSSYNIALNGNRDIGSTIKPLLYYEALKCGYTTSSTQYSAPYSFLYKNETVTISNSGNHYANKEISMKTALATSDNIYAIKTHLELGTKTLANHLKNYGISASPLPSLALGSVGMSLYQLTKIYTQFFTEGNYLKLRFIEKISIDGKTKVLNKISYKKLGEKKYFQQIKSIMNGMFDTTIPHATGASIANALIPICYGKSGLTDYDSYMIGFSDEILISVWVGFLNNEELVDINNKRLPKEIFLNQMNRYTKYL